jgi:precorrin-4/cobalt-precorrin-4 C11-methyltransferase
MIFFVGAGSGDPEFITLKGYRLLQEADLIVYAGSLVNEKILDYTRPGSRLVNSAPLDLEEIMQVMMEAHAQGDQVVRLHTGDPSLYGAIGEQMAILEQEQIPFQVIPGVSSFLAAAASLKKEYTIPDGTQTLIITRLEGRTPVPTAEKLGSLAAHGASMAIFLSIGMIDRVVTELLLEYAPDTPVAVVEKASWPEERIIQGALQDLPALIREAGIKKTALILVGKFLIDSGQSKLYDKEFTHEYRG